MHEEIRLVSSEGVVHRAFRDQHGTLYVAESCNTDDMKGREVLGLEDLGAIEEWERRTRQIPIRCLRCFPSEDGGGE